MSSESDSDYIPEEAEVDNESDDEIDEIEINEVLDLLRDRILYSIERGEEVELEVVEMIRELAQRYVVEQ
jgi:hypothetical protein